MKTTVSVPPGLVAVLLAATMPALLTAPPATAAPASAARACASFAFKQNGVPWRARKVRARGLRCARARDVIRAYAKPRNCQFEARCRVGRWLCRTLDARGSRFTEQCTRGRLVVRWRGSYVSN